MLDALLLFTAGALLVYVLMGGADYGAGILELYAPVRHKLAQRRLINHAMGPVWEANHMWLIILVVIFFMGFPGALATLMTSLHLPVVALLLGIVVRGAVFTFRHYDAEGAARSQEVFTALFAGASLWSSMWLGILAASLFRGQIDPQATDFFAAYVAPWWGAFPLAVGLLVAICFAFLASLYLVSETQDHGLQDFFLRRARRLNVYLVTCGASVFVTAYWDHNNLPLAFANNPWALACLMAATALSALLWQGPTVRHLWAARALGAGQVSLVVLGWFVVHAPNVYVTREGPVAFADVAAPEATLRLLLWALVVGSAFVLPGLVFLLHVFKRSNDKAPTADANQPQVAGKFVTQSRSTFTHE